ncbi:hypothetical protein E3N88_21242 [Mikania micrantha]|uniref:PB1-like domain-containing protein n=1 Tax=Mikania micrantha TaxID=192012 RepID=A0A5N6NKN1_9ASTR|nr:hypothetical protein E3N88_21242 [Mikania micrantha]
MEDDVLVKVWYGGKLSKNPKLHYVGGETSMIKVEVDKMSYFELVDYVMEVGSYEKKDFLMFYLLPGKKFKEGLVELKNDEDVSRMMVDLEEDVRHTLHLYVESKTNKEELPQPSKITAQKEAQLIQNQTSTSSPLKLTKSAARRLPCNTSISEQGSEEGYEEGSEDEYGSDTDDEEWRASIGAIKKSDKEDESSKKKLLDQFLAEPDSTHEESVQITHHSDASSYEDSDVNSPGNSEDDDIRGRKYNSNVPVVTENTDWSKWKWVVGTRFPTRDAFRDAVRNYVVYLGRDVAAVKLRDTTKKPRKLSGHGVLMTCSNCKVKGHNKRKCPEKGNTSSETRIPKKPRGRPRKQPVEVASAALVTQQSQQSTITSPQSSQPRKSRGMPRKSTGADPTGAEPRK